MAIFTKLALILLLLCTSSCSAKKNSFLGDTKLIISVEEKDYSDDKVIQHYFFENGIYQRIITHNSSNEDSVFGSNFKTLNKKELGQIKALKDSIVKLNYKNTFPWKEGLYDRGNVYRISYLSSEPLEYIVRKSKTDIPQIKFSKSIYYYAGHDKSPAVFKDLADFLKTH